MILKHHYWFFKSAVPKETCDKIIQLGLQKNLEMGNVRGNRTSEDFDPNDENHVKDINQFRDSNVSWMSEKWLYEILQARMDEANQRAGWNYDWDWCEDLQFTVYKPGQYYHWHADQNSEVYPEDHFNPNFRGKYRKLSVILHLSDPAEYVGGELEFGMGQKDTRICSEIKPQGSLVVFPSFINHRVHPVTSGTRYSLVMWTLGRPFR